MIKSLVGLINIVLFVYIVGLEILDLYLGWVLVLDVDSNVEIVIVCGVIDKIKEYYMSDNVVFVDGIDGVVDVIGVVFG